MYQFDRNQPPLGLLMGKLQPFSLSNLQDLLNFEPECSFEEHFFHFRLKVKSLELLLVLPLQNVFDGASSLPGQLRVLELYQGIVKRDVIKVGKVWTFFCWVHLLFSKWNIQIFLKKKVF